MTIRHLTVFVAVAEQGSMSAAAKHLYISQPTVSQAIRELENHYNGLLFERLGKKTLSHRPWKTASSTCPGNDPAVSAAGGTDAESGAVFHPEAWFHPHGWNLPDTVHYPGSAEKISGSGCLLFCHQHQEHRAETSPLRTGRCCGRR